MAKQKAKPRLYIRIDNITCDATKCVGTQKGFSFLPVPAEIIPEVFCGNCGGRVDAEFLINRGD